MRSSVALLDEAVTGASAARSLHESLIDLLPDAVLTLDVEAGRLVLANVAAEHLLGTSRGHLTRLGLRDLVRPWDLGQVERAETALAIEGRWRGELWLKRQDGTFVPTEATAQASRVDGRTLAQFCCRDASARWRDDAMRQVISHAAERLAATFDDREALRTVVTVALPALADAALVELDSVDDSEPEAVAAFADVAGAISAGVTVDEAPSLESREAVRRGRTLTVPLLVPGRRIGTLTLRRSGHREWDERDRPLVEELAGHAAHAIDQARRWGDARQELAQRAAMLRLLAAIDTDIAPRGIFEMLLEEAQAVMQADDGGAARWYPERGVLHPALPRPGARSLCLVDPRLMVAVAAAERCALIENEYQRTMGRSTPAGKVGAQAVMAVPIVHHGELMGSLSLSHITSARRFQPRDARRLELLASAAATTMAGIQRQRTTGARLAAREAAHLLNNDLAVTMGSLDLARCEDQLPPAVAPLLDSALDGLSRAADHLAKMQRLKRVETCDGPLGMRLDLARSVEQRAAIPPPA